MKKTDCLFCKIVAGEIPSHKIWEDENHLAFLTPFPNTEGFTVITTKKHYDSYFAENSDPVTTDLLNAAKKVAKLLDLKLEDVGRTALVFEGFGVDHLHAKLFPMHGTNDLKKWEPISSKTDKYFKKYEGYISSHDGAKVSDIKLAELARKIREEKKGGAR